MIEAIQNIDAEWLLAINGCHAPFWDSFMKHASGKIVWIPLYISLLYCFIRNYGVKHGIMLAVMTGIVIALADQTCATFIRPYVQRMRPSNPDNPLSAMVHLVNGYHGGRYGFPSCHAANTFGLTAIVYLITRNRTATITLVLWAALNCYSRMYLGVHYPGDIFVGACVGCLCAIVVYYISRYLYSHITHTPFCNVTKTIRPQEWIPVAVVFACTVVALLF